MAAIAWAMAVTDLMQLLLQEFDDVFTTPTGLPPLLPQPPHSPASIDGAGGSPAIPVPTVGQG
jgi:hypothetical protein